MKEPGFYLYVNNFITGTMAYSDEQVGAYIRLLILQFNNWDFTRDQAKRVIENWNTWDVIQEKFKTDGHGNYWNERLRHEMEKRKKLSESGKKGADNRWKPEKNGVTDGVADGVDDGKMDGKTDALSTDIDIDSLRVITDNEYWKIFIAGFNEITGRNFRGDEKAKRSFSARLKQGYTMEQFGLAIQNCISDEFHRENPKYLTPEFITRQDKLEKYLNYVPTQTQRDKARNTFINILNEIENEQTKEN